MEQWKRDAAKLYIGAVLIMAALFEIQVFMMG